MGGRVREFNLYKLMKFLTSVLKSRNKIIIDHENDDNLSDISESDPRDRLMPSKPPIHKFKIAPLHRAPPPTLRIAHKVEHIEIRDSDSEPIFHPVLPCLAEFRPQARRRLIKLSNKCKIEGKDFTSECSICLSDLEIKDP